MVSAFIVLSLALTGCGGLDKQSQQCLDDLRIGLQTRWNVTDSDYSTYEEYIEIEKRGIIAELEMLNPYVDVEFKNEEFGALIDSYISALNNQRDGIESILSEPDRYYNLYFEKGMDKISECLNTLTQEYEFSVDPEYAREYNALIKNSSLRLVSTSHTMEATTLYGDYEIKIVGAAETEWDKSGYENALEDSDESTYPATIRCEVNNISYSGLYEGSLCGYDLCDDGSMLVKDSEGFVLDFYDIAGTYDGEYSVSSETPIGSKARVSYPYIVPNDESSIAVIIDNKYKVFVEIDRENIVSVF